MSDKPEALETRTSMESLKELLTSAATEHDFIGVTWKSPWPGRYENQVRPGMMAVITTIDHEGKPAYELTLVGASGNTENIGYFPTKRSAAVTLVKMIKGALDDCEKLRDELWRFVMANECVIM